MTNISYDALVEIADRAGLLEDHLPEDAIHTDYSGRGMSGRTCVGFRLDHDRQLLELGAAIEGVAGLGPFGDATTDSLGRGIIVYFRGVSCDDAPGDDE